MVPRPPWTLCRIHRGGLRNRDRAQCGAGRQDDPALRLPAHADRLGSYPGNCGADCRPFPGQAAGWVGTAGMEGKGSRHQGTRECFVGRYDAVANAAPAVVLRRVRDDDDVGLRRHRCNRAVESDGGFLPRR